MAKPQGMPDFMHIGLEGIAIDCRAITPEPAGADIHPHGGDKAIGPGAARKSA